MKRASAIKVVLSCTGLAEKKKQFQFYFFSEIRNFNIGGPVNQLIKKRPHQHCRGLPISGSENTKAVSTSGQLQEQKSTEHLLPPGEVIG
jgi:hypothetical protein